MPELLDAGAARRRPRPPTSGCRTRRCTRSGTARSTPRPSCSAEFVVRPARAVPRRDRRRPAWSPRPAATSPPPSLALAPARAGRRSSSRPASSSTPPAACPAPAGRRRPNTTFCTVDEDFTAYGLLDHRHTPEIEQVASGAAGAVHPAPGADEPGHPRHLLRPPDRRRRHDRRRCSTRCTHAYDDEPFVVVTDGSPSTKATLGSNTAHVTARVDERTGWVVAIAALDNLVKGASGQAIQCANLAARPARDRRPPDRRGVPVSVTAPARASSPRASHCRHQGRRATPTSSLVATADGAAGRRGRRVHPEPA